MLHIIVNPVAGKGRTMLYLPLLMDRLNELGLPCEVHITTKVREAYFFAKDFCCNSTTAIIGIGGDGTMQEIVAGMADAYPHGEKIPIPLGILPGGSGNDFITTLEGGKAAAKRKFSKDIHAVTNEFANKIFHRSLRTIDLITANGEAYLNIGNIGIDAKIVNSAITLKQKLGGQAYIASVYKNILKHKNTALSITLDNKTTTEQYTLAAVCNGEYYGGGLHIAPPAKPDDGKITLCTVAGMSRARLGILFPSLLAKKHEKLKEISFTHTDEVTITLGSEEILCLDGNLSSKTGKIVFKILPKVLDVFI